MATGVKRALPENVVNRQSRYGNHARAFQPRLELELVRNLMPFEIRQPYIEQDDIGPEFAGNVDRREPVDRKVAFMAHHFDEHRHRMHGIEIVVDHEHAALWLKMRLKVEQG